MFNFGLLCSSSILCEMNQKLKLKLPLHSCDSATLFAGCFACSIRGMLTWSLYGMLCFGWLVHLVIRFACNIRVTVDSHYWSKISLWVPWACFSLVENGCFEELFQVVILQKSINIAQFLGKLLIVSWEYHNWIKMSQKTCLSRM